MSGDRKNKQTRKTSAPTHVGSVIVRVSIYKNRQPVEQSMVGKQRPWRQDDSRKSVTALTYVHSVEVVAERVHKYSQAKKLILVSEHGAYNGVQST